MNLLEVIVKKLEIELSYPEQQLVTQGDVSNECMYFVEKGECSVMVKDKVGLESGAKKVRTLFPGDHFGVTSSSN